MSENGAQEHPEQPSQGNPPPEMDDVALEDVRRRAMENRQRFGDNTAVARALQRTMGVVAESEVEENLEEIRVLDRQIDGLNTVMERVENRLDEHHSKIKGLLETQQTERVERKTSLTQRLQEAQTEDEDFSAKIAEMLNRCRKMSAPAGYYGEEQHEASGQS